MSVRASLRCRGTAVLVLLLAAPGCFVSPTEADSSRLTFSVGVPAARRQQAQQSSYWDALGLFYLYEFPKYVRVAVEHPDGYELASGTWPDPQQGVGSLGEGVDGEVVVSMEVPSGNGRRLRVLGFVRDADRVRVYEEREEHSLDLVPGQNLDLEIDTVLVDTGSVDLTVRCQEGAGSMFVPQRVYLVDIRAAVIFPSVELWADPQTGAFKAELPAVPVGRHFWPRIVVRRSDTAKELVVEVRNPTFVVRTPDGNTAVSYAIPCQL